MVQQEFDPYALLGALRARLLTEGAPRWAVRVVGNTFRYAKVEADPCLPSAPTERVVAFPLRRTPREPREHFGNRPSVPCLWKPPNDPK